MAATAWDVATRELTVRSDAAQSLHHTEGVRSDLQAAGLSVALLDGRGVVDLLADRLDPTRHEASAELAEGRQWEAGDECVRAAARLRAAPIEVQARQLLVGGRPEATVHVSLAPEQTWLGWLLHLMGSEEPFTLSVHVTATDRHRERTLQRRRYRRVYGVNRGVEARGQLLDPDARLHEQDALELNDELAASTGAGIYRVAIYATYTEPGQNHAALTEVSRCGGARARDGI